MADKLTKHTDKPRRWWHSRWLWALAVLAVLTVAAYVVVPPLVVRTVNQKLAQMPKYDGHVDDAELSLLHGSIILKQLKIWNRKGGSAEHPFVQVRAAAAAWIWDELLHGRMRFDAAVVDPRVVVIEKEDQSEHGKSLGDNLRGVFGDKVRSAHVENGDLALLSESADGETIRIGVHGLTGDVTGLLDRASEANPRPAHLTLKGTTAPEGTFRVESQFDPLDPAKAFALKSRFATKKLEQWNRFLAKTADFKVKSGEMTADVDLTGKGGALDGTLRPYIKDIEIANWKGDHNALVATVKNALLGVAADILQNNDTHTIAARVPIHGRLDQPGTSVWSAAWSGVKHAFAGSWPGRHSSLGVLPGAPKQEPPPKVEPDAAKVKAEKEKAEKDKAEKEKKDKEAKEKAEKDKAAKDKEAKEKKDKAAKEKKGGK